jgi:peroxiredoxin Q/BCP
MKSLFSPLAAMFLAVAQSAWAAAPVEGSVAPDFSLPDASGKERRLADWRGRWLVLYFYPKDDTPGCTTEARNFRDRLERFAAQKAEVVGVSLDDGASHRAFADKHRLPFTLLSDAGGTVAKRYGALSDFGAFACIKSFFNSANTRDSSFSSIYFSYLNDMKWELWLKVISLLSILALILLFLFPF